MSAKIFDGKRKAEEISENVRRRVAKLHFTPKLISFYKPDDPGSALYTRIKKQKAQSVGIEFEDIEIYRAQDAVSQIRESSKDPAVHGILVQHPSGEFAFQEKNWQALLEAITKEKDVDGLRDDSPFLPATVKAVLVALNDAGLSLTKLSLVSVKVAVVGATGIVGRALTKVLKDYAAQVIEIDVTTQDVWFQTKKADIVISATGNPRIINGDMIKKNAIVIDVGAPGGDVDFDSVKSVASFITPVPGGIGPVTVACLLENLVEAASKRT
ncbi:MAG: bifunctional 5,10-methylenetetrahydrofolate dehydrogenase/5,10-methenyltetrahydrofolate cyclohydrolase [Candidatus Blackburnbacteria bacterium]|nr:bifunctional 5,10-methylenetetrahydrofolate dehydrogenase/5,10-methenyltetrahydrofolate cyclohydrolase [Candidatus Blackburnbacteria bacterium]